MKLIIDISKDRYDEIMSMDWKNCRRFFDEEIRAIHDGKVLEQEPCWDAVSRQAVLDINERHHGQMPNHVNHEIWKEIKALSSVTLQPKPMPQEQCEDCISHEAVMHILDEVGGDFDSPREAVVPIDYIADMVSELPPVTPQRYAAEIEPQKSMVVCTYQETGCGSCEYQTNCPY